MIRDVFETKIIQERVLEDDRLDYEAILKKSSVQTIVDQSLSLYDSSFKNYEDYSKGAGKPLSLLEFRDFAYLLNEPIEENLKRKYIERALYDASYEYLDSDESYDASEEIIDPLLVMGNYHK